MLQRDVFLWKDNKHRCFKIEGGSWLVFADHQSREGGGTPYISAKDMVFQPFLVKNRVSILAIQMGSGFALQSWIKYF